jgi:ribonucleoside-diphosphate reductase alpha chain
LSLLDRNPGKKVYIFETLKEAAVLQQVGSGVGFPFLLLRPAGFACKRSLGRSAGPLAFLRIYSESFRIIQQHGRDGANMALMRIDRPDMIEFIEAKARERTFENFHFSIAFTDAFMSRVLANDASQWLCERPRAASPATPPDASWIFQTSQSPHWN